MIFNNKKAQSTLLFWLIDILVFIIVLFTLLNFVDTAAENVTFEKIFLSRHFALLADTILSAPYDISFKDPSNTLWFTLAFNNNQVQVYDTTINSNPPLNERAIHYFIEDKNIRVDHTILGPSKKIKTSDSIFKKVLAPVAVFYTEVPKLSDENTVKPLFCKHGSILEINTKNNCEEI